MKYKNELQSGNVWHEFLQNLSNPNWFHFIPRAFREGRLKRADMLLLVAAFAILAVAPIFISLLPEITVSQVATVCLLPQVLLNIFQVRAWRRDRPSALILLPINLMLLAPVAAIIL